MPNITRDIKGVLPNTLELSHVATLMVAKPLGAGTDAELKKALDALQYLAEQGLLVTSVKVYEPKVTQTLNRGRVLVHYPYSNKPGDYGNVSYLHREPGSMGVWWEEDKQPGDDLRGDDEVRPVYITDTEPGYKVVQVSAQALADYLGGHQSDFEEAGFYSRDLQAWLESHKELARIAQMKAAAAVAAAEASIVPWATLKRDYCFWNPDGDLGAGVIASFENRLAAVRELAASMGRQVQAPDGRYFVATVIELADLLEKPMIFREKTQEERKDEQRLRAAKNKKVEPMRQS